MNELTKTESEMLELAILIATGQYNPTKEEVNQMAILLLQAVKDRDVGWSNFYVMRKEAARLRFPNSTNHPIVAK